MRWREVRVGVVVYRRVFTHWGKGVVEKVNHDVGDGSYAYVKFEGCDGRAKVRASELRVTPNKKKMDRMIHFYKAKGVEAYCEGGRLMIPGHEEPMLTPNNQGEDE